MKAPILSANKTPIREFQVTVSGFEALAQAPIVAEFFAAVLAIYVVIYLALRLYRDTLMRRIENRLYLWSPQRNTFIVELTVATGRNQPQLTRRGTVLEIGQSLLLRRDDGFQQEIEWRIIRSVAAAPIPPPPAPPPPPPPIAGVA
jgi:hypothetical protein